VPLWHSWLILAFNFYLKSSKMKTYSIGLLVFGLILAGCTGDLEKRVADLEGRVAALESGRGNRPLKDLSQEKQQPNQQEEAEVRPDGPLPAFQFEKEEHDFGTIKDGDLVEYTFKFKNVGQAPLIISDASATCGCTVPKWPKEPIPVGGSGEIQVRFDSKGKPGIQAKTVTIKANTYPSSTRLRIRSNVTAEGK
jgi:hypothetical protein